MSSRFKKAVEKEGLRPHEAEITSNENLTGIHGDRLIEPQPNFISTKSEKTIKNENNSWIVLGRDRPSSIESGYGGKGDTQCGSIDIVVGRTGWLPKGVDKDGKEIWIDPSQELDAARIVLSQKTDVDENFELSKGSGNAKTKSAIALKADAIRIISRENIKLVTGVDSVNSQGGRSVGRYGIDLIANNEGEDLQPIPLGMNLVECLNELNNQIDALNGVLESFMRAQMQINSVLAGHVHVGAIGPVAPSVELAAVVIPSMIQITSQSYASLIAGKANSSIIKINYLTPYSATYINSRNNKTN